MDDIRLVAGLGNPGEEYRGTRHNVGFDALDLLADGLKVEMDKEKFGASFGQINIGSKKLILLKPMLFMNNSGQAVSAVCNFYKIAPGDVLVLTDDLALEPGMLRIRSGGSADITVLRILSPSLGQTSSAGCVSESAVKATGQDAIMFCPGLTKPNES